MNPLAKKGKTRAARGSQYSFSGEGTMSLIARTQGNFTTQNTSLSK
ncbi:MAG: hypothetical protein P4M11_13335 [Candidatus Pacebacteria bacterium]|nr:hypothetical protein [Candidatus Paceibacterota bacterium]